MSEFVKLTRMHNKGPIWVNFGRVRAIFIDSAGDSLLEFREDEYNYVTETPEQIMALIDGPADRDEMANELAEALKVCISQIEHLHAKFQTTESGNATIAYAKDAIALWESLK